MVNSKYHNENNASPAGRTVLGRVRNSFGSMPNVLGVFTTNPAVIEERKAISEVFEKAGFSPLEARIVSIAAGIEKKCEYFLATHNGICVRNSLVADAINAVRADRPISDARLESLRVFTNRVVEQGGIASDDDVEQFIGAGWDLAAVDGVIRSVSL